MTVPCWAWKCVPTVIFGGADFSKAPECHFVTIDEFSVRVVKLYSRIGVLWHISKAFDKVWYEELLYKLETYGVKGEVLNLLRNYLHER